MEECKVGRVPDWKHARLEECKIGRVQDWKSARLEECKIGSVRCKIAILDCENVILRFQALKLNRIYNFLIFLEIFQNM